MLNPPIFPAIFFPALGVFWIFVIWVLWKIVQSLRGIDESLKSAMKASRRFRTASRTRAENEFFELTADAEALR